MILSSPGMKAGALVIAISLHVASLMGFWSPTPIEMEGAAGSNEAKIGTSFADLSAGTLAPEAVEDLPDETADQVVLEKDRTEDALQPQAPEPVEPLTPSQTTTSEPVQSTTPIVENVPLVPTPDITETIEPEDLQTPQVAALAPDASPEQVEAQTPSQLTADEADTTAVTRSLRPTQRSADFEKRHKPKPTAQPAKPKVARGNSNQNATQGATTATKQESNTNASGSGTTRATGNAAASNYPGKVMKRISRVPRPRVGTKGTAVVAFRIGSNGALAGVSLAKSSGSSKLDQAALRVIQRAAPFPPPPAGARQSFSIKIQGR